MAPWHALGYTRVCGISVEQHEGMESLKEEVHLLMQDTKQVMTLPTDQENEATEQRASKIIHLAII